MHRAGVHILAAVALSASGLPCTAAAKGVPLHRDGAPELSARSVLVIHNKTGTVLVGRRATEVRSIASLTKLQAALVFIARGLKLDQGTVINREDWKVALKGCRTRLELKWTYRNRDLLHAALMASDNRAVSALGRAVGLHANQLVQAMNEQARRMGLRKTTFRGPVGIDPGNKSTAWEIARIVRQASKVKVLREVMGKKEHLVKPMRGYIKVHYRNTNPLVASSRWQVDLTKTGYLREAGRCLVMVTEVNGRPLALVLLNSFGTRTPLGDAGRVRRWITTGDGGRIAGAARDYERQQVKALLESRAGDLSTTAQ